MRTSDFHINSSTVFKQLISARKKILDFVSGSGAKEMKVSALNVGVYILLLSISAGHCAFSLSKRQNSRCGDPTDPNTPIGRCTIAGNTGDVATVCNGCVPVFRRYFSCIGVNQDAVLNQLQSSYDNLNSDSTSNNICSDAGDPNSDLNTCLVEFLAENDIACQSFCRSLMEAFASQCLGQEDAQIFNDEITAQCGGEITITLAFVSFTVSVLIAAFAAVFN